MSTLTAYLSDPVPGHPIKPTVVHRKRKKNSRNILRVIFNLQHLDDKEIQGGIIYQAALKAFKYGAASISPHLGEMLLDLSDLPDNEERKSFISVLFRYIISVGKDTTEKDIEEELRSTGSKEARETYMTIAERLKEKGKIEGKLEGIVEGEILGQQHMILRLLEKKFGGIDEAEKAPLNTLTTDFGHTFVSVSGFQGLPQAGLMPLPAG